MSQRGVNAVELTVDAAWFIADAVSAGTFPWVLAITPPYRDQSERNRFAAQQAAELTRLGVMVDGKINPAVQQWIRTVCYPQTWLELRFVGFGSEGAARSGRTRADGTVGFGSEGAGAPADLARGIIARDDRGTVVALRSSQLVTFTEMRIDDPEAVVPAVTVGLAGRAPASFEEFTLPAQAGARADQRLRDGAELSSVLSYLGIPKSAHAVADAALNGPRRYVEIVAGERRDAVRHTSEVGVGIIDTALGRVLVSPGRDGAEGGWQSTFAPGTPFAIALALHNLTETLPGGPWFPAARLTRDFTLANS